MRRLIWGRRAASASRNRRSTACRPPSFSTLLNDRLRGTWGFDGRFGAVARRQPEADGEHHRRDRRRRADGGDGLGLRHLPRPEPAGVHRRRHVRRLGRQPAADQPRRRSPASACRSTAAGRSSVHAKLGMENLSRRPPTRRSRSSRTCGRIAAASSTAASSRWAVLRPSSVGAARSSRGARVKSGTAACASEATVRLPGRVRAREGARGHALRCGGRGERGHRARARRPAARRSPVRAGGRCRPMRQRRHDAHMRTMFIDGPPSYASGPVVSRSAAYVPAMSPRRARAADRRLVVAAPPSARPDDGAAGRFAHGGRTPRDLGEAQWRRKPRCAYASTPAARDARPRRPLAASRTASGAASAARCHPTNPAVRARVRRRTRATATGRRLGTPENALVPLAARVADGWVAAVRLVVAGGRAAAAREAAARPPRHPRAPPPAAVAHLTAGTGVQPPPPAKPGGAPARRRATPPLTAKRYGQPSLYGTGRFTQPISFVLNLRDFPTIRLGDSVPRAE